MNNLRPFLLGLTLLGCFSAARSQNNAISFSGTNYIDCGSTISATSIKTMEAWVKFNNFTGSQEIISRSTVNVGIELLVYSNTLAFFCMYNNANNSNVAYPASNLSTGVWYHIAATWDGSTKESMRLYVNNVSVGTRTDAGNINSTGIANPSGTLKIGQWSTANDRYLNGYIDEVRLWNVARTSDQLKASMYNVSATTSGLLAYYKMDAITASTTMVNQQGDAAVNGTLVGSPVLAASPIQSQPDGLNFDGVDDRVLVPANAAYNVTTGTVELWVNVSAFTAGINHCMVGLRGPTGAPRWSLHLTSTTVGFFNGAYTALTVPTFSTNTWYHLAFVTSGSSTEVYINGVDKGSIALGYGTATGLPILMGMAYNGSGGYMEPLNGSLDEVRIWNTARTPSQISNNMGVGLTGYEPGLVGLYAFDQGIANGANSGLTTAIDGTTLNNHGVLSNFSLSGTASNYVSTTVTPLPVQFGSFTVAKSTGGALLRWQTQQEQNSRLFIVERSAGSPSFLPIGQVDAAGNSTSPISYSFTDAAPLAGVNYYRLRETDLDDKPIYSVTVSLNYKGVADLNLRILPNPVSQTLNYSLVSAKTSDVLLRITDLSGRQLISRIVHLQQGANQSAVDVSGLPAGGYVLQLIDDHATSGYSKAFQIIR